MSTRPPRGGTPPPDTATLPGGYVLFLAPLAHEVCRRYMLEFPGDRERYGDAADAWCVHDTQYLLAWAAMDAEGGGSLLERNVDWLARVLAARGFPLEQLVRDLELAAEVVTETHGEAAAALAERLRAGTDVVRSVTA